MKMRQFIVILLMLAVLPSLLTAQNKGKQAADPCPYKPHVVKVSSKVLRQNAVKKVDLELSKICRCAGTVLVDVLVDYDGTVNCLKYVKGHPLLREAAMKAVKQWQFKLLTLSGVQCQYYGTLELTIATPDSGQ